MTNSEIAEFQHEMDQAEDLGPLPWWTPTKKTPTIIGKVIEYRNVDTEYGRLVGAAVELLGTAVVQDGRNDRPRLAQAGEYAIIWQKNRVLQNAWAEPSTGGTAPAVGEVVGVKRVGERHGTRGTYPVFIVRVHGRRPANGRAAAVPPAEPDHEPEPDEPDDAFGDPGYPDNPDDDLPF